MRNILKVAALTGILMGGAAPAFADGDYLIGGATVSGAWRQPFGAAPRVENERLGRFTGGDDQYVVGPTRSLAWSQPADGAVLMAASGPASAGNFVFASQGS